MTCRFVTTLFASGMALVLFAAPADADKSKEQAEAKAVFEEATIKCERLARQFREAEANLLRECQRLEKSDKPEEREKARVIKKVLEKKEQTGVDAQLTKLIRVLKNIDTPPNLDDLKAVAKPTSEVIVELRAVRMYVSNYRLELLREQRKTLDNMLKQLHEQIRQAEGKDQDDVLKKLKDMTKKLEETLRQVREEEMIYLLDDLSERCLRMLKMQMEVQEGTAAVDRAIRLNDDKKPKRADEMQSYKLSDKEDDIVREANKVLAVLQADGSTKAFPEVFNQIEQDMMAVSKRLRKIDAGTVTQSIQKDIIEALVEVQAELTKARKELSKKANPQKPVVNYADLVKPYSDIEDELHGLIKVLRELHEKLESEPFKPRLLPSDKKQL